MHTWTLPAVLAVITALFGVTAPNALAATADCGTGAASTISAMQSAAASGSPFTLSCSLSATDTAGQQLAIGSGKAFTLDLAGNTLAFANDPSPTEPSISVPSGSTFTLNDSVGSGKLQSGGTIALSGTLNGTGSLDNAGAISEAASTWSIPGDGSGIGGVTITGNIFELTFSVEFGTPPSAIWVFAPTLAAADESLPSPSPGYTVEWDADGSAVSSSTELNSLVTPGGNTVALSARYTAIPPTITSNVTSKRKQGAHGWWLAPVTVSWICSGPPGLIYTCPGPTVLKHSGKGLHAGGTVSAANETSASATVEGIKIDLTHPRVTVHGVIKGHTYTGRAPDAKCRAKDSISGISSCKLHKGVKRHGRDQTITYTATATSGSGRTAKATVRVTVAPR